MTTICNVAIYRLDAATSAFISTISRQYNITVRGKQKLFLVLNKKQSADKTAEDNIDEYVHVINSREVTNCSLATLMHVYVREYESGVVDPMIEILNPRRTTPEYSWQAGTKVYFHFKFPVVLKEIRITLPDAHEQTFRASVFLAQAYDIQSQSLHWYSVLSETDTMLGINYYNEVQQNGMYMGGGELSLFTVMRGRNTTVCPAHWWCLAFPFPSLDTHTLDVSNIQLIVGNKIDLYSTDGVKPPFICSTPAANNA